MQLTKMELRGFKSFADKTTLTFDKGITAIVGPNGSGKSNISDAVRWVMGEQNVRQLRGQRAEDIIFPVRIRDDLRGLQKYPCISIIPIRRWTRNLGKSLLLAAIFVPVTVNFILIKDIVA